VARKLDNWLAAFISYTDRLESPLRFRTWTGLATICAALQRKVRVRIKGQDLFVSSYYILVGPPGIGKGNAIKPAIQMINAVKDIKLAPTGLTRRSFYNVLEAAKHDPVYIGEDIMEHCSLTAFIEELGVFLKSGDLDFVYSLCHVWDCPPWFHYKTATSGENEIANAWFSMLACATPKGLKDILTDDLMEVGLSARTVLIFSDEEVEVPLFGEEPERENLKADLESDLRAISKIRGYYTFTEGAAKDLVEWSKNKLKPIPLDPRFVHYNTRRLTQVLKRCMLLAAARSDDLIITEREVAEARSILLEAERVMPKAIESIGANPLLMQQQMGIKLINKYFREHKGKGMPEHKLRQHLSMEVHPQWLDAVVDNLAFARWVKTSGGEKPNRVYYPATAELKEKECTKNSEDS
jgi:hypothetical protein